MENSTRASYFYRDFLFSFVTFSAWPPVWGIFVAFVSKTPESYHGFSLVIEKKMLKNHPLGGLNTFEAGVITSYTKYWKLWLRHSAFILRKKMFYCSSYFKTTKLLASATFCEITHRTTKTSSYISTYIGKYGYTSTQIDVKSAIHICWRRDCNISVISYCIETVNLVTRGCDFEYPFRDLIDYILLIICE